MTGEEHFVPDPDLSGSRWRKSSRSSNYGNCVEVARLDGTVAARDSKDPGGGVLRMSPAMWGRFLRALRADRFTA